MSELREYQRKMLDSKSEIVMCNWSRRKGKTYSIIPKITKHNYKCLYISKYSAGIGCVQQLIRDYIFEEKEDVGVFVDKSYKSYAEFNSGNIIDIEYTTVDDIKKIRGKKFNLVFFDEYIPNCAMINLVKELGAEQIFIMTTLIEDYTVEYIDDSEFNKSDFYDKQIKKLMIEFENIPKGQNTTITREKILYMIEKLQNMKNK